MWKKFFNVFSSFMHNSTMHDSYERQQVKSYCELIAKES